MQTTRQPIPIKAILFDLDGVIVFSDRYHYLAWKQLANEQGWRFDETLNHQLRGIPRLASLRVILRHNGLSLAPDVEKACCDRKNHYYVDSLQSIDRSALYPGVIPFLDALHAKNVKLGLCSSSRNAGLILDKLDLHRYFDAVISGHDITHPKPHPEIFLKGAEALNTHPVHCLVFEDAEAGIAAALAANMPCIGVGTPDILPNAPLCITDYATLDINAMLGRQ